MSKKRNHRDKRPVAVATDTPVCWSSSTGRMLVGATPSAESS